MKSDYYGYFIHQVYTIMINKFILNIYYKFLVNN